MKKQVETSSPSWQAAWLVCKQCAKRGSGCKSLKAKEAVSLLRQALKSERPRPRVLQTGCLGLCPKRALAIALVGANGVQLAACRSASAVGDAVPLLSPQSDSATISTTAPSAKIGQATSPSEPTWGTPA